MPGAESLREHRAFLRKIGHIISGQDALQITDDAVHVFQLPAREVLEHVDGARDMNYGRVVDDNDFRGYCVDSPDGPDIYESGGPQKKLEFLASVRHIVVNRRRELSIEANEEHSGQYIRPGGQKGHLIEMYDDLLDQIDRTHYRLRDRVESADSSD